MHFALFGEGARVQLLAVRYQWSVSEEWGRW